MPNAAWLDPNINAWWLDRSSPNDAAASAGVGRGMQMAQQRMEMLQQAKRDETVTKFKMLDFMLESERNGLALRTFQSKQQADMLRTQGMTEIGEYLGNAVKNGKLIDPETQAGFFRLTSKYAPFINEQTVNSMWDNTFASAMRREDEAKKIKEGHPQAATFIQYKAEVNRMKDELKSLSDKTSPSYNPDLVEDKKQELERFRIGTGLVTAEESKQMKLLERGGELSEERAAELRAHQKAMADLRIQTTKERDEDRANREALELRLEDDIKKVNQKYGMQVFAAMNDLPKREKLVAEQQKEMDAVFAKHRAALNKKGEAAPAPATGTKAPAFRFDPATDDLVPIK